MRLCDKRMKTAAFLTVTSQLVTTTRTVPSRTSCLASSAGMEGELATQVKPRAVPVPREDEPNLYNIPNGVYPEYRPVPLVGKAAIAVASIIVSAVTTWRHLTWLHPLVAIRSGTNSWSGKQIIQFASKALIAGFLSNAVIQDIFLAPSRVSTDSLLRDYFLPSSMSNYESVTLPGGPSVASSFGVHFLRHEAPNRDGSHRFQALYVNHGFGASSLSWLPALPSLVAKVGARVGLGHDAPGFGFTSRPKQLTGYTSGSSADIGTSLLDRELQKQGAQPNVDSAVALFGHSMGSQATLKMALSLPSDTRAFIVLVAPALGVSKAPTIKQTARAKLYAEWPRILLEYLQNVLLNTPLAYLLRRVVGTRNFWRRGLRLAWGDANRITDSDILRFQWPSIGKGWERGLLSFSRAQFGVHSDLTDSQLLEKVLARPHTSVVTVYGTKDNIIKPELIRGFFRPFPQVKFYELPGQGHDPFEEQVDTFVSTIERILAEDKSVVTE